MSNLAAELPEVLVEQAGNVGRIALNDPNRLNSLTPSMAAALDAAFERLSGSVGCIVLTGEGKAFCSGAYLSPSDSRDEEASDFGLVLEQKINPLMIKLRDLPIPWISSVRGPAAGVGCSLALAGDLIIASETAYFLQAFSRIGLVPDGGSAYLLARSIGRVRASEMMLLGERITAPQAFDWGLINRVVPDDALDATAMELAARLANGPRKSLGMIRKLGWAATESGWHEMLKLERTMQREAGQTLDAREGIAAFLEKRSPEFRGE